MMNDIARIELERVFRSRGPRQYDSRIQRTQSAGCAMRDKMYVRKSLWVAFQISRSCGLSTCEYFARRRREMFFDVLDFQACLGQLGIIGIGRNGIADEQKFSGA